MPNLDMDENLLQTINIAAQVLLNATDNRLGLVILSGRRSWYEQAKLYAQGRVTSGPVVTWTMRSKHLEGRAVDLSFSLDGRLVDPATVARSDWFGLADLIRRINPRIRSGGSYGDFGHFQIS